jgi:hypothetical protein
VLIVTLSKAILVHCGGAFDVREKWGAVMPVRATLLSLATLFGITLWGMAVYSDASLASGVAADGYGVSTVDNKPR